MRRQEVFCVHLDAILVLSVCAWVLILWRCFLLKGAQALHEWKSKCHGCVRHGEKCAFLGTGKAWGVFVKCRLLLWSQRGLAWFHSTQHYKFWLGPCHPPLLTAGVTHLRVVSQYCSSTFGSRGQKSEALPHATLPFSWGRACCRGYTGAQGEIACSWVSSPNSSLSSTCKGYLHLIRGGSHTSPLFPSQPPWGNTETHCYTFFVTL